jgi:5-(carboxyamino)imidazole ribonucleotide mutase
MSAHLPGVIAAMTILPVIGVPLNASTLNGLDSLMSIVQMPGGIPVATTAIGKSGCVNAALLAVSILALSDAVLTEKLKHYRKEMADSVIQADEEINREN